MAEVTLNPIAMATTITPNTGAILEILSFRCTVRISGRCLGISFSFRHLSQIR